MLILQLGKSRGQATTDAKESRGLTGSTSPNSNGWRTKSHPGKLTLRALSLSLSLFRLWSISFDLEELSLTLGGCLNVHGSKLELYYKSINTKGQTSICDF